jgi:hypothetical protein
MEKPHLLRPQHFVVLEVGRGNLGRALPRIPAEHLCTSWNGLLAGLAWTPRFSPGYGHTGNYLLNCAEAVPLPEVVGFLHGHLDRQFAVFAATDYYAWVDDLASALAQVPEPPPGRRATPGAVMDLDATGGIPGLPAASVKISFSDWAMPRVRSAWKYDILRVDGRGLDSTKRDGGWGAVAAAMVTHAGGRWTARALSTLHGLAQAARSHWGMPSQSAAGPRAN